MKNIFFGIIFTIAVALVVSFAIKTQNDTAYYNACVISDSPVPVGYESFYIALFNHGPRYRVTYEGHTRFNGETCTKQVVVDVDEYARVKVIVGEKNE